MRGWTGEERRTRGRGRKERKGRKGAGVKNKEDEECHGCWVIDTPGGRLSGMVTKPGGMCPGGVCPGGICPGALVRGGGRLSGHPSVLS